ncbi:MAG: OmpA family protein [Polyangiaceae bacterium]|nr:OmpA family protein [Polyangiaceae bacterium]
MSIAGPALGIAGLIATAAAVTCAVAAFDQDVATALNVEGPGTADASSDGEPQQAQGDAAAPDAPPPPVAATCAQLEIEFAPSSTVLSADMLAKLQPVAQWLDKHEDAEVFVDGHADAHGSEDSNMWVSHERARVVSLALTKDGVAKKQMVIRAFGSYAPVGDAPEDHPRQRSVVVSIKHAEEGCPPGLDLADGSAP